MYNPEIPFHRLIYHFVTRIFYGAGEGDELQFGIPALLGLLSTPSAFGAISLMNKYSTLLLYLTNRPFFDVYRASVPDEYFFIVYAMVITGGVVVLKWDRLFPDRQDYDNLAVLPLSTRKIFTSSLFALLFLTTLFAIDINWAACFIFPFAVTSRYDTVSAYTEFFIGHTSAVILASFFACFALLSVMGITLLVVPRRYLRSASLIVRIACALALIAILGSAFSIPGKLLAFAPPEYTAYLPPVWFLDLHQFVVGRGSPFSGSPYFALEVTIGAFVLAMVLYALTYYRQFRRIPEANAVRGTRVRDGVSVITRFLDQFVVRTPFQRGAYHFALRTIFRSERHCLLFGSSTAVGLFIAAQSLADVMAEPLRFRIDSRLLSIPLTLSYFIICSARALYDLPTDRSANWIFRATVDQEKHESRAVGMKVMMTLVVPWLVLIALPLFAMNSGLMIAVMQTIYVFFCTAILCELLLVGFRKIPFTCLHVVNKDLVLVNVILFFVGFSFFSLVNAATEARLLQNPTRLALLPILYLAVRIGVRRRERDLSPGERSLIFEDRPEASIQVLDLSR
jgi:hypothetical protein